MVQEATKSHVWKASIPTHRYSACTRRHNVRVAGVDDDGDGDGDDDDDDDDDDADVGKSLTAMTMTMMVD